MKTFLDNTDTARRGCRRRGGDDGGSVAAVSASAVTVFATTLLSLLLVLTGCAVQVEASGGVFEATFTDFRPGRFIGPQYFPTPLQAWMIGHHNKGLQVIGDSNFNRDQTIRPFPAYVLQYPILRSSWLPTMKSLQGLHQDQMKRFP